MGGVYCRHMKYVLIFLSLVIIIVAIILAGIGVIPGLSNLIGAGQKDLGIRYALDDSRAAWKKSGGTEIISLPSDASPADDFRLEGKKSVSFTMNSTELTAHSNNRSWKNYPVKNIQIKIHDDGTIESSAILLVDKAMPYAMALGYSEQQIRDAMKTYAIPPFAVPIYVLGKGSVRNNSVQVDARTVKIGAIPIPGDIVARANKEAESVLNDVIAKHTDAFRADEVSFADGTMTFIGAVPEKEYVITK